MQLKLLKLKTIPTFTLMRVPLSPKRKPRPKGPVATPCRANQQPQVSQMEPAETEPMPTPPTALEVESLEPPARSPESEATKPNPKMVRISEAAADARLRRCFQPSLRTGTYKVSDAILKQYKENGKGRKSLRKVFETCCYDKDRVFPKVLTCFTLFSTFRFQV